jgi:hypothetical protein
MAATTGEATTVAVAGTDNGPYPSGGPHALWIRAPLEPSDSEAGALCRNEGLIATRPSP